MLTYEIHTSRGARVMAFDRLDRAQAALSACSPGWKIVEIKRTERVIEEKTQ